MRFNGNKEEFEAELNKKWGVFTKSMLEEGYSKEDIINVQIVLENSYAKMLEDDAAPTDYVEKISEAVKAQELAESFKGSDEELKTALLNEGVDEKIVENILSEAPVTSGVVGNYVVPKVTLPIIRRVLPYLFANKLVSVQPTSVPTGVIYYISYKYATDKGTIASGDEASYNPNQTTPAYAVFYTSEEIGPFSSTTTGTAATDDTDAVLDDLTISDEDTARTVSFLGTDPTDFVFKGFKLRDTTTAKSLVVRNSAYKKDSDVGSHIFVTCTTDTSATTITFGSYAVYNYSTGAVTILAAALEAVGADVGDTVKFSLKYDQENTSHIPEMEFSIDNMPISLKSRKLKFRWTKESEQDMMAYHKISVEQELVKIASTESNYEQDRELLNFIEETVISDLAFSHDWTNDSSVTGNNTSGNYLDRHRALAQKIYQVQTKIAEVNHISPADWVVISPRVAAVLQMLPDFKNGEISAGKTTFYNAGTLGGGVLQAYVDMNRTGSHAANVLLGYKAKDSTYGSGIVYSPYSTWTSGTVTNPTNFESIRGMFNRYALTRTPRAEYNYGTIDIDNLIE